MPHGTGEKFYSEDATGGAFFTGATQVLGGGWKERFGRSFLAFFGKFLVCLGGFWYVFWYACKGFI